MFCQITELPTITWSQNSKFSKDAPMKSTRVLIERSRSSREVRFRSKCSTLPKKRSLYIKSSERRPKTEDRIQSQTLPRSHKIGGNKGPSDEKESLVDDADEENAQSEGQSHYDVPRALFPIRSVISVQEILDLQRKCGVLNTPKVIKFWKILAGGNLLEINKMLFQKRHFSFVFFPFLKLLTMIWLVCLCKDGSRRTVVPGLCHWWRQNSLKCILKNGVKYGS